MPIYEYERRDGQVIEVIQKISEAPLKVCPTTGLPVSRKISHSAFHLKGSGWYKTDYAAKTSAKKNNDSPSNAETVSGTAESSAASTANNTEVGKSSSCGTTCGCH